MKYNATCNWLIKTYNVDASGAMISVMVVIEYAVMAVMKYPLMMVMKYSVMIVMEYPVMVVTEYTSYNTESKIQKKLRPSHGFLRKSVVL